MGAPQDHGVDIRVAHGFQIIFNDLICHHMFFESLFYKGNEQRTGFLDHVYVRRHLTDDLRIHPALDCGVCSDYADFPVLCSLHRRPCAGNDHAHHRYVKLIPDRIQRQRAGCIAGDDNGLDLLFLKEADDLFRKPDDRILGFASVRHPGRISEIYDILIRELAGYLSCDRQSAHTGIKDAYRRCLPVLCTHVFDLLFISADIRADFSVRTPAL